MPFFILSSGRSGSTLLASRLDNHPAVIIPGEQYFLAPMLKRLALLKYFPWKWQVNILISLLSDSSITMHWDLDLPALKKELFAINGKQRSPEYVFAAIVHQYAELKGMPLNYRLWGDGTPATLENIHLVIKAFPGAKYIGLTRDGRDVVNSLLRLNPKLGANAACKLWNDGVGTMQLMKDKLSPGHFINEAYENLVTEPISSVKRISSFLGLEFEESMMTYSGYLERMGRAGKSPSFEEVVLPVHKNNIGKWRKELPFELAQQIMPLISNNLKLLGYI